MKNRMRIDDIKVGEEYAARVSFRTVRVKVLSIDKLDEGRFRQPRMVRTPHVELLDDTPLEGSYSKARTGDTFHLPAREFYGPWDEVSAEMERKRAARAGQRAAVDRLNEALDATLPGDRSRRHATASNMPGRVNLGLSVEDAEALARLLEGS